MKSLITASCMLFLLLPLRASAEGSLPQIVTVREFFDRKTCHVGSNE